MALIAADIRPTGWLAGIFAGLICSAAGGVAWSAAAPRCDPDVVAALVDERPLRPLLAGRNHARWPVETVQGFLFVPGSVHGVKGAFLVDTGSPFPVLLNHYRVPLRLREYLCTGSAGSGQRLPFYRHERIGALDVAGWSTGGFAALASTDLAFASDIRAGGMHDDLLGLVGLALLRDHEFVLDYRSGSLDIYRTDGQGNAVVTHFDPADRIATLRFVLDDDAGQLPAVALRIGEFELQGLLDTGNPGVLTLTAGTRRQLAESGLLQRNGARYRLVDLAHDGIVLHADAGWLVEGEYDTLGLGHNLLGHYRSVWNFHHRTVTLLTPTAGDAP